MTSARLRPVLRAAGSALLLAVVLWQLGAGDVLARLAALAPGWLAGALAVTVLQVLLSAWRWHFTARRLGLALPFTVAVREYYLATLINQLLPGGVLGDAGRAWRHARQTAHTGGAVRAVVLERASGQLAMVVLVFAALAAAPPIAAVGGPALASGIAATGALGLLGALGFALRRRPWLRPWLDDAHQALLHPAALPLQLLTSLGVVASYVAVFSLCALAVGIDGSPALWLPLIPLVLLAMLTPVGFAGWGLREGAAAVLWSLVGLPAADGVAVSVTYGLVILAASIPGAAFLRAPR